MNMDKESMKAAMASGILKAAKKKKKMSPKEMGYVKTDKK